MQSWHFGFDSIDTWYLGDDTYRVELCPEFQRGHTWKLEQQCAYIEYMLRGGKNSRTVIFNQKPGASDNVYQCVDGLQRLTSIYLFMHDNLKVFGGLTCSEMVKASKYKRFPWLQYQFQVETLHLKTDAEIMKFYLELNEGGTPHSQVELERVHKLLLKAEKAKPAKKRIK
jgi:uncharacterized protein with ParB-like and HNH nuclease domain